MTKVFKIENIVWDAPKKYSKKLPKNVLFYVCAATVADFGDELEDWMTDKLSDNFSWLITDLNFVGVGDTSKEVDYYDIVY